MRNQKKNNEIVKKIVLKNGKINNKLTFAEKNLYII